MQKILRSILLFLKNNFTTTLECHQDDLVKFASHFVHSKPIKNLPVLEVKRWSLGGQGAS